MAHLQVTRTSVSWLCRPGRERSPRRPGYSRSDEPGVDRHYARAFRHRRHAGRVLPAFGHGAARLNGTASHALHRGAAAHLLPPRFAAIPNAAGLHRVSPGGAVHVWASFFCGRRRVSLQVHLSIYRQGKNGLMAVSLPPCFLCHISSMAGRGLMD